MEPASENSEKRDYPQLLKREVGEMKKWEYKVVDIDVRINLENPLNLLGDQGWEVIQIHFARATLYSAGWRIVVLKREKLEERKRK